MVHFFWKMGFLFSHDLTYHTCTFDTWCFFFGSGYIFSPTGKHTTWKNCTCIGADGRDLSNISANITVQYKKSCHSSVFLFRKICISTSRQCGSVFLCNCQGWDKKNQTDETLGPWKLQSMKQTLIMSFAIGAKTRGRVLFTKIS